MMHLTGSRCMSTVRHLGLRKSFVMQAFPVIVNRPVMEGKATQVKVAAPDVEPIVVE